MVKTRDFLLFVVALLFLLTGIAATVAIDRGAGGTPVSPLTSAPPPATDISAEVSTPVVDRLARLSALRALLAEHDSVLTASVTTALADDAGDALDEGTDTNEPTEAIVYCDTYPDAPIVWPAARLSMVEREGARLLVAENPASTSSPEIVVLQLPIVTTAPTTQSNCIPAEVVGVAQDGLPIKNSEVALFSVFGPDTLVGYALDGFPIYGANPTVVTDQCGGIATADGYRYVVHPDRPGVLGCFTATPVDLRVWLP